jgi:Fe2+ transport system protein FeoA
LVLPPEQTEEGVAVTLVGAAGPPVTVTVTGTRVALGQVLKASA